MKDYDTTSNNNNINNDNNKGLLAASTFTLYVLHAINKNKIHMYTL